MSRITRTDEDLLKALADEITKLGEFYNKVYVEGDKKYLPNIASQLRILIIRKKRNHALLLDILDKYKGKIDIKIEFAGLPPNHPDHGKEVTLEEYLEYVPVKAIRTQSGKLVSLNYKQLIEKYSQQFGGAHQDPAVEEDILAVVNTVIPFANIDVAFLFKTITKRVLEAGNHCVKKFLTGKNMSGFKDPCPDG